MKLKEYLENFKNLVEGNPDSLEYEVVYSIDDEGNAYKRIYWGPSLGIYDDDEFCVIDDEDTDDEGNSFSNYTKNDINAICIN